MSEESGTPRSLDGDHPVEVSLSAAPNERFRLRHTEEGHTVLEGTSDVRLPDLEPGRTMHIVRAVPGDATYRHPIRILDVDPAGRGTARIEITGPAERQQQRNFVRARTTGLGVVLIEADGERIEGSLLNISAGGLRAAVDRANVIAGSQVRCQFELPAPGDDPLQGTLRATVVRVGRTGDGRQSVAVAFDDLSDQLETRLTRWVFRQQSAGSL